LTFPLIVAGLSGLIAVLALVRARSAGQRAERLADSYWELRYEISQLKVRLGRVENDGEPGDTEPDAEAAPPRSGSTTSFVPLASLKK